ncbi:MAG: 30S ribosomal protein S20 [Syntrophorhabdus sp. PtaB.Bin184]|nr:MAG: 30S ribosomal protein S20 [Syntrophorhabdus sp. PtaB.Bin184]
MRKNKSAIKRAVQSEKRRLRNSHFKSTMKSRIKRAIGAIDRKEGEVETIFRDAVSSIDKAASKGVVHRNNAARKISRLARKLYKSQTA